MANPDPVFSLYIHVPFCADKCLYCDFYSVPRHTVSQELQAAVIEETVRQARHFLQSAGPDPRIPTIFMGGGTPSSLPPMAAARLLESFRDTGCIEWTVEANPESLDGTFLEHCHSSGVTRLSVGVQSLRDDQLRLLKRPATRADTLTALSLVQRSWKGELNLDFIAGIPHQTPREVREDLDVLKGMKPSHVSLYQLTYEPGTELALQVKEGRITRNPAECDEALWFAGKESLEQGGYENYEISNVCLPGRECRHNLRYWHMEPYIGVGPGAVSTLPAAPFAALLGRQELIDEPGAVLRLSNPKDLHAFLGGPDRLWGMEVEIVRPRGFLLENLMMGFRLAEGIQQSMLKDRFGWSFNQLFPGLWDRWVARGLASPPDGSLKLTERGRLFLDALLGQVMENCAAPGMPDLLLQWPRASLAS